MPLREMSRLLHHSRNTIRRLLRHPPAAALEPEPPCDADTLAQVQAAFTRCRGNVVRVQEVLGAEHGLSLPYSTLTRWVRAAGLRAPVRRVGEYVFAPGEEMQHDTSPHRVALSGQTVTAQCAALVLACSRRLFCQYYLRFTRFEAKAFLAEAFAFMDGTCARCVIDNTSVLLAAGAGPEATIAPELAAFGRAYGVTFRAHRVGDPDRKARIERPFDYVEKNFLAGRSFRDFADLNAQARTWCTEIANRKVKRALGMSPEAAYLLEKPHLTPLPSCAPPVYESYERIVDVTGYVSLDTHRYSVPERYVGQQVTVYKYPEEVRICQREHVLASHPRFLTGREQKHTLAGHHTIPGRHAERRGPAPEEAALTGQHELLDRYVAALKRHVPGRGQRALRRLLELQRTYPSEPFLAAIEQALPYGLFDLARLEALILRAVAGDFFQLPSTQDEP
jgi:hypothetical protein